MAAKRSSAALLPPDLLQLVQRLADAWAVHPDRPSPRPDVLERWDALIAAWADDVSLPLFIRKVARDRGCALLHPSGRMIVPTDNSPAQWAFGKALRGEMPSLEEVRRAVDDDQIPVAMVLTVTERATAKFRRTLTAVDNLNAAGWKLGHIQRVGLGRRARLPDVAELDLRQHFRRFLSPRNMFVVPTTYAGLAELPEMCRAMRDVMHRPGSAEGNEPA